MASQAAQVLPVDAAQAGSQEAEATMDGADQLPRKAERAAPAEAADVQEPPAKWRRLRGKQDPGAGWVITLSAKQLAERDALLERLAFQEKGAPAPAKAAYSLFSSEARQKAHQGEAEVSAAALSQQIAKDWAALPPAEKSRHEAAAAADDVRAKGELAAFKQTDAFRSLQSAVGRYLRMNSARRQLGEPEVLLKEWKKQRMAEQAEKAKAAKAEERGQEQTSKKEQREHDALVARLLRSVGSNAAPGSAAPPQLAQTPYVLFLADVKGEEAAKGGSSAELMKRIAVRWSGLDASAKALYVEKAAKDKERYERELQAFRASDVYQELSESVTAFRSENSRRSAAGEGPRKLHELVRARRKDLRAKAQASRKRAKLLASLLRRAPRSSGLRAAPKPPPAPYALFAAAKRGEASGGSLAEVMKKLGSMWQEAPPGERAVFAREADAQRARYESELKAFQLTDEYSSFVAAFGEWERAGKGAGAFWAWHAKREKLKLAQKRSEAREQAKVDRAAARAAAKAHARAARAAAAAKPKAAGSGKAADAPMLPALLEEDPFWDSVGKGAAFDEDDLVLNDKLVAACARRGGPAANELLDVAASRSKRAASLFRPRSADCPETSLHYALLRGDVEMLRILAREMLRSSGGQAPAVVPKPKTAGGSAEPEPAAAPGVVLWYCSSAGGLRARAGPAADAAEAPLVLASGTAITVEECKGEWIKTAGDKWLPLMCNGVGHFTAEDPEKRRQRQSSDTPELRPVSTGFASGRAYRAKKLRKVKLSRGGREGNQAFVRDMADNHYGQPRPQLSEALHWAAERGVPLATLTACCELFSRGGTEGIGSNAQSETATLLGSALRFGRAALARELAEKFGASDFWGLNALHKLALKSDPSESEIAESGKRKQSVLKKAQDNFEVSPLHCASVGPELRVLQAMLDPLGAGAEDQSKDDEDRTLLHYAAAAETPAALEMLLERRFSPHRADKKGITPLMCACMANRPDCVKRLLAAGADPMVRADERTSFHWAAWYGAKEALLELLEHAAPSKGKGPSSFEQAANSSKQTALHFACARGEEGIVEELLKRAPKSLHKSDKQGRTPLIWAVMNGNTKLASFLLSRGADVSKADTSGNTPLHYALAYGWRDAAQLLVEWGHEPDVQNTWRNTPVDAAILKAHYGAVAWFAAKHPINPDVKDATGRTLLSRACGALENRQWRAVLRAIVESRGADVNLLDGSGTPPICLAVRQCAQQPTLHSEVEAALRSLCAAKADLSLKQTTNGPLKDQSALSIALRGRNHGLLCLMLQSGAGVAVHGHGETLLHILPEQLITPGVEKSSTTRVVLDAIKEALPKQVLKEMVRTPDQRGLLPIHAAALRFNNVMEQVRQKWEEYRKREALIKQGAKDRWGKPLAEDPSYRIQVKSEEDVLRGFRDLLLWLRAEADVALDAQVAQLAEPRKVEAKEGEDLSISKSGELGRMPSKFCEILDSSVQAHDKELWRKYDPVFGLATPLMILVAGGCSAAVEWLLSQLHDAGLLAHCLSMPNLYGNTPLAIAVHQAGGVLGLMPEVIRRLVTPAAVGVRSFDGRTPVHLATEGSSAGWGTVARPPPKCPRAWPDVEPEVGIPAAAAPTGAEQQATARSLREKIMAIWRCCRQDNLSKADANSFLDQYNGRELFAYKMVCKRYGVEPDRLLTSARGAAGPSETAASSDSRPLEDPRGDVFEAVLAAAVEAGAADVADCNGLTPLHVAVQSGRRQVLAPELMGGPATSTATAIAVVPPGESVPMYELRGLEPGKPFGLPHCRVSHGAWYFELRTLDLLEGRVGFADARAVTAGGGSSSGAGLHWVPQQNSWPPNSTIGVAVDADRHEVRIAVNGTWGTGPDLQNIKFDKYLFPVISGQGRCEVRLSAQSAPRTGDSIFRPFSALGPFVISSRQMVDALLSARANADAVAADEHALTALHVAAKTGDAAVVQRLCDAGARANTCALRYGCTALHLAVLESKAGTVASATALIVAKADVNMATPLENKPHLYAQRRAYQRFPLHAAVEHGSSALVGLLVKAGADTNAPIEVRTITKCQHWLPLPSTSDEPSEPGSRQDRGLQVGAQVALRTDVAVQALQPLGVDAGELERAVGKAVSESAARGPHDVAVLTGSVARIAGDGNYELGGGDFAPLLGQGHAGKLVVPRGSLLVRAEVDSVQVRVSRPLHHAAERNAGESVQELLLGRADPSVPDGRDGRLALHHVVEHRNAQAMALLVRAGTALDTPDATQRQARPLLSAVTSALAGKGLGVLEDLLKARAGINLPCAADGLAALHLASAVRNGAVVDLLLQRRADPSVQDLVGRTPLHKAVNAAAPSEPSFDLERKLLDAGAPVNALDKRGRTPLHYAFVKEGKPWDVAFADPVETVTSFCAVEGVRVDLADEFGATPLLYAAKRGATISSLYLAKRGVSLQARDVHENDVLGMALAAGHHEYAITLLSKDAGDVHAPMRHVRPIDKPDGGAAAQPPAPESGEQHLSKLPGLSVGPPVTLFYEAIKNKWLGLAYLLLDHGFPFHKAIQDSLSLGEFRLVLTLLSKINPAQNELVRGLDAEGRNLLHVLADFPDKLGPEAGAISKELAQRGVQPGQVDSKGRLPLHGAAANGHLDLCRWLVSVCIAEACLTRSSNGQVFLHGVSTLKWLRKHGEALHLQFLGLVPPGSLAAAPEPFLDDTLDAKALPKGLQLPIRSVPLVNAAALGFMNSAAKLLDAQADCNTRDGLGETALGAALRAGRASVAQLVKLLLFNGADANLRDGRGDTPLRGAVRSPHSLELVQELVNAGALVTEDPGQQPAGGSLILDALQVPSTPKVPVPPILEKLLELKAQPDQGANDKGCPPLIVSVDSQRTKVLEALLAAGAAPGCTDAAGRSALTAAIALRESGQGMAIALLDAKADPQGGRDAGGRRPLFAAVEWGSWEVVDALLRARADANQAGTDDCGRTPLSVAVRANAGAVAMSLLSALADPKAQDKHGRTAAHHCVQPLPYGSYENADLLAAILQARGGRDSALTADGKGLTAVQLACAQGSGRMAALLAREGLCEKPGRPSSPSALSKTAEPTGAASDIEADALLELERIEASATPMPIPVHGAYGMAGDNKVFEQDGVEHDALLFKVDLKRNEMRFYHLQLVYEVNKDLYVLFTRWGEVGETGMYQRTPQASLEEGLKEYGKVFREKTGNVWATKDTDFERKPNKYHLLRHRKTVTRHDQLLRKFETERPCKLPSGVQRTVRAMCDPVMVGEALASLGIKTQSMPFGSLTRATLNEAKELLGAIRLANEELRTLKSTMGTGDHMEAAKKRNDLRERVLELSSRYYELVPRNARPGEVARPLEREGALAEEFAALIDLAEASVGVQLLLGALHRQAEEHPFDYCLRGLGISLEEVDPASEEFAAMLRYAQSTCTSGEPPRAAQPGDFVQVVKPTAGDAPPKRSRPRPVRSHDTVTAIYRLARKGETARFAAGGAEDMQNRRLLWHGSRLSNMIGIMTQGLRVAPPEAPVSGYMFGKGVYFADMFSKSRQYCRSSGTNEPAYMMLCDVALGEMYRCREALYMDSAQTGTHSTWGQGFRAPDWANQIVEPGGAAVPKPALGDAGKREDYRLNFNEFIVYDPAQIQMRYLIELNNFECHVEERDDAMRAAKRLRLAC